jgi:hypothetical protein
MSAPSGSKTLGRFARNQLVPFLTRLLCKTSVLYKYVLQFINQLQFQHVHIPHVTKLANLVIPAASLDTALNFSIMNVKQARTLSLQLHKVLSPA